MTPSEKDLRIRALQYAIDRKIVQTRTGSDVAKEDVKSAEIYLKFLKGDS